MAVKVFREVALSNFISYLRFHQAYNLFLVSRFHDAAQLCQAPSESVMQLFIWSTIPFVVAQEFKPTATFEFNCLFNLQPLFSFTIESLRISVLFNAFFQYYFWSFKDFFRKFDLVTIVEEILNGKLHFVMQLFSFECLFHF